MSRDTLTERWLQHVDRDPGRIFSEFIAGDERRSITHGEVRDQACGFARLYRAEGLKPGDIVLIVLRHSPDLYPAFLGAMMAGCIPSFMPHPSPKQDPGLYWSSHHRLFARIGAGAILAHPDIQDAIRAQVTGLPLHLLGPEEARLMGGAFEPHAGEPGDIAFLQHSSGTTGLKKGIALSHRSVLNQVAGYSRALGLTGGERIVSWLPLYHDMGFIACFILPLVAGLQIVHLDPFEWVARPELLLEAIERFRGTHTWLPNFAFQHLCRTVPRDRRCDLGSMRAFINCSEPCRAETFEAFLARFGPWGVRREQLQVCYAMAETVFAVTQTQPDLPVEPLVVAACETGGGPRKYLPVGRPIGGMEVRICDEDGFELPEGRVGEVTIRGGSLFSGYFRLEEETRRRFRMGWYFSGDLGFLSDGSLFITGRKNDLIIVHGRNHYAHDIECIVNGVDGCKPGRSVAVGLYVEEVGSEELVVIAETEEADASRWPAIGARVKKAVFDRLDVLPRAVRMVGPGWLVKTTSGKISRSENLKKYVSETRLGG